MSKEGVYLCADIGVNFEGKLDVLDEMMRDARTAGCDAVKLQLFDLEYLAQADYADGLREELSRMCIPSGMVETMANEAHGHGLEIVVTPFTREIAMGIPDNVDGIKIRSADCFRTEILTAAMHHDKPVYVSVPTTDGYLKKPTDVPEGAFFSLMSHRMDKNGYLVMCPPGYPQKLKDLHLHRIVDFDGFSSHGRNPSIPLMAATLAVNAVEAGGKAKRRFYLEVHAIPDHEGGDDCRKYPDHDVSLSWEQIRLLASGIEILEEAI